MNPFRHIDDFLFDRVFQPIVNRFPDAGPVGVARFFLVGSMVAFLALEAVSLSHHYVSATANVMFQGMLYLQVEKPACRLGARNPRRISSLHQLVRLAFMLCVCVALMPPYSRLGMYLLAGNVLYLAFWYAGACDRMPPRQIKAGVWDSGLVRQTA